MSPAFSAWRVLAKGFALFLVFEAVLGFAPPDLRWLNVYAWLQLKRERLPNSTHPPEDSAQQVGNLDAMFAAHIVSAPAPPREYRLFLFGDSAVWGMDLAPGETLSGQINALGLKCAGRSVRAYNLSFPFSSATKDLMLLDRAMPYHPDKILWLITLHTLIPSARTNHFLIGMNPAEYAQLGQRFGFVPPGSGSEDLPTQIDDENSALFHILKFQLYGAINLATGIEQIPAPPEQLPTQLSSNPNYYGLNPPLLNASSLSIDQVRDFLTLASGVPVMLINQPIKVMTNVRNSDIYYDVYYPRWIYDQYRHYMTADAAQSHWNYLDLWNALPAVYFTDTPLHLNPAGELLLARQIAPGIVQGCP